MRFFDIGLCARKPATGLELLRHPRVERLRFAREHENWSNKEWSHILFLDEWRVCLRAPDGRERIYRRTGEHFFQNHFSLKVMEAVRWWLGWRKFWSSDGLGYNEQWGDYSRWVHNKSFRTFCTVHQRWFHADAW